MNGIIDSMIVWFLHTLLLYIVYCPIINWYCMRLGIIELAMYKIIFGEA